MFGFSFKARGAGFGHPSHPSFAIAFGGLDFQSFFVVDNAKPRDSSDDQNYKYDEELVSAGCAKV
jgi:hypothetical protein